MNIEQSLIETLNRLYRGMCDLSDKLNVMAMLQGATLTLLIFLFIFVASSEPACAADFGPYRVSVVNVIDGDTIKVDVELWPGLTQRVNVRVAGINAPEISRADDCEIAAGKNAKAFVQGRVMRAENIVITDIGPDKYAGRVVAKVWMDGNDLAEMLIATGHARPYDGGKREPWCE